MKRKIEIFTANCLVCDPVVKLVNELSCGSCDVTVYDLVEQCDNKAYLGKTKEYGITRVPAVVVDGKLLSCCQGGAITRESLINAGVGQK
jgi:predicted thioredoxin/glutaredoxin